MGNKTVAGPMFVFARAEFIGDRFGRRTIIAQRATRNVLSPSDWSGEPLIRAALLSLRWNCPLVPIRCNRVDIYIVHSHTPIFTMVQLIAHIVWYTHSRLWVAITGCSHVFLRMRNWFVTAQWTGTRRRNTRYDILLINSPHTPIWKFTSD